MMTITKRDGKGNVVYTRQIEDTAAPKVVPIISFRNTGPAAWKTLHLAAQAGTIVPPSWFVTWESSIPRIGCSCLSGYLEARFKVPFRPKDQFAWSVDFHNAINAKLNKPILTLSQATAIWSPPPALQQSSPAPAKG